MEEELFEIFQKTNKEFLQNEVENIQNDVAERNLCGRLAMYLNKSIENTNFSGYYVDPEYNRKQDGQIKTILDDELNVIIINCDIILHSRGESTTNDNLIAFEMKKSNRPEKEKNADRKRLRAMTKESYNKIWSADGITHPEHVCGYIWGVYIEINNIDRIELIEYYQHGELVRSDILNY